MQTAAPPALPAIPTEMSSAIRQARASMQQFLDAFSAPGPNRSGFLLRVRLTVRLASGRSAAEHLWLTQLDLTANPPTGVIATDPYLPGFARLQRISFQAHQVSDWLYRQDGVPVGAFTTRALGGDAPHPTSRFTLLRDLWML